jgi:creatinine amidohydrolase
MRWEELTGERFAEAVAECEGVCAIPLSVIERHGRHLPMGTDMFLGRETLTRAAAQEAVIEFPDYIFTQIPEARHRLGTISIDGDLMVSLLDNVCREVARNGCKKIVLVNAHGGNQGLVSLFSMLQLYTPRDYVVYLVQPFLTAFSGDVDVPWASETDGHAGPGETSMILRILPELVHLDQHVAGEGSALGRLSSLRDAGVQTGISWYSDFPTHYSGDASTADADAGDRLLDAMAQSLVTAIRAIKADTTAKTLQDEFFAASESPS